MLTIKDSTGKTVGVLKDGDSEPEMTVHKDDCPCQKGKMLNCSCKQEAKEKEQQ